MHRVTILGSGKIGAAIAKLLHHSGDYEVSVADRDQHALDRLSASIPIETRALDVTDQAAVAACLRGREIVISACPFFLNPPIAQAALVAGASYFDLTEDRATTTTVRELAARTREGQVFVPQCGLAPGFVSILAHDLCRGFEKLDDVKMRVGALPQFPSNMLMYNLTWSTDGLINEYCNPCEAIHDQRKVEVMPLEGPELFSLDGINYEAFNTSGGLGTLCETLDGRVRQLDYKTVRYRGHQYLMTFLIRDLKLGTRRHLLKEILEAAVPITFQDVVLIFSTVSGWIDGQLVQHSNARKIYHQEMYGEPWSSIQITTAAGICAVVDLHTEGRIGRQGMIRQESVALEAFLGNRFGSYYPTGSEEREPNVSIEPLRDFVSS
jgi:saccharopine dehydrogenase-like NADP-dependent oxidoreductase